MASKRAVISTFRAASRKPICSSVSPLASSVRELHAPAGSNKIVGVFYKANEYASLNPNFLGCVENALGIREWLESKGHQYIVTDDKEGPDCVESVNFLARLPFPTPCYNGSSKCIVTPCYNGSSKCIVTPCYNGSSKCIVSTFENCNPLQRTYILNFFAELEKHIPDLHVLISTPFHPAYMTAERIKKAKNLKLLLTAGIGSDHIDLNAAAAAGVTVSEVTGSNVVSVAEDELMRILILVRNFVPGYKQTVNGDWEVAAISYRSYDLEGKTIGTIGAGRIGKELLKRLKRFNCKLLYHDRLSIGPELEKETGATLETNLDDMLPKCDVVVINMPLSDKTRGMFNKEKISKMKKGVLIVNNARGAIMDAQAVADASASGHIGGYSGDVWEGYNGAIMDCQAVADAIASGHIGGYSGDVWEGYSGDIWFPEPAPKDHPWRSMPNHAMTPHISGTTIDAQIRYAAGTKDMLDRYFRGEDFPPQHYIIKERKFASQYYL